MPWQAASHEKSLPPSRELLVATAIAPGTDVNVASVEGALDSQCLRIHEQMEAQRRRLAAIQQELAEQLARLMQQADAPRPADTQPALDEARRECEQLRAQITEQEAGRTALQGETESLRQEAERLAAENQRLGEELAQRPAAATDAAQTGASHECEQLRAALAEHEAGRTALQGEVESLRQEVQHLAAENQRLGEELATRPAAPADAALAEREAEQAALHGEVESLRQELQRLATENQRLGEELAQRPAEAPEALLDVSRAQEEYENLQRRYQMALDDLKAERAQVAQLESKLAQAASGLPSSNPAAGQPAGSDWESQKRRLLASLEADFEEDNEETRRDRLNVEEAIRRTDAVVAAKNQEIEKLQSLLQEQSASVGSMAVGAAAVAEVLDKDEVIRQERQNLQALQEEWRDKLRHAEVEISVQRAKLARHQAELEERARLIEEQSRGVSLEEPEERKEKPSRGNWLRRLGLKSGDEE
jgi:chromosome segregation ATPase